MVHHWIQLQPSYALCEEHADYAELENMARELYLARWAL